MNHHFSIRKLNFVPVVARIDEVREAHFLFDGFQITAADHRHRPIGFSGKSVDLRFQRGRNSSQMRTPHKGGEGAVKIKKERHPAVEFKAFLEKVSNLGVGF